MKKMTLGQHFSELRRRILWTLGLFGVFFVGGWYVAPFLQEMLSAPLMSVWPDGTLL